MRRLRKRCWLHVWRKTDVHARRLGLCSQRSSFLIWERASGQPVTPLISWQDDRGAESCAALRGRESTIRELSGLPLTPYYLAPKMRVLLRQHPSWRERLLRGDWLLGTLDTFLIWRWTDGKQHVTDVSMAARTLLMDIHGRQWSPELCELFDIPQQALPQIKPSAGLGLLLNNGLVLQASLGDQSAALVASIATGRPEALVNLGTGGFVVCYLPEGQERAGRLSANSGLAGGHAAGASGQRRNAQLYSCRAGALSGRCLPRGRFGERQHLLPG